MTNTWGRNLPALRRAVAALLLLGATAFGAAACGSDDQPATRHTDSSSAASARAELLDVDAFAAAVARPGTTVLDVRTPTEFAAGHLAGAVNLDVQSATFADAVAGLDPAGAYAVYCHSGNRSAVATSYLVGHGFAHVQELKGGIAAWQAAGRPVTTG